MSVIPRIVDTEKIKKKIYKSKTTTNTLPRGKIVKNYSKSLFKKTIVAHSEYAQELKISKFIWFPEPNLKKTVIPEESEAQFEY